MNALLHNALVATGHVHTAAIIRRKDGGIQASVPGFKVCWAY